MAQTDKAWERFGNTEPYHSVLTKEGFRKDRLDERARAAFFQSGEDYVSYALDAVREHLDAAYSPTRALDFGCGVGRLTIPLARRSRDVVGVDVSQGMLTEAIANAALAGLTNVRFAMSDDRLSAVDGTFDLVHSFIVLQHLVPERGEAIVRRLIERLRENGVGILHMTYAYASRTRLRRRIVTAVCERVPGAYMVLNLVKHQPLRKPMMLMGRYDMSRVLRILQEAGCHDVHVRFTESAPIYGVILFFKKAAHDVTRYS